MRCHTNSFIVRLGLAVEEHVSLEDEEPLLVARVELPSLQQIPLPERDEMVAIVL
jgi:hypothetical protein